MAPRLGPSIVAPEEFFRRSTRYNSRGDLIAPETADTSSSALDLARSVAPTLGIDARPLDLAQRVAPSLGIDLSVHPTVDDTRAPVTDITPEFDEAGARKPKEVDLNRNPMRSEAPGLLKSSLDLKAQRIRTIRGKGSVGDVAATGAQVGLRLAQSMAEGAAGILAIPKDLITAGKEAQDLPGRVESDTGEISYPRSEANQRLADAAIATALTGAGARIMGAPSRGAGMLPREIPPLEGELIPPRQPPPPQPGLPKGISIEGEPVPSRAQGGQAAQREAQRVKQEMQPAPTGGQAQPVQPWQAEGRAVSVEQPTSETTVTINGKATKLRNGKVVEPDVVAFRRQNGEIIKGRPNETHLMLAERKGLDIHQPVSEGGLEDGGFIVNGQYTTRLGMRERGLPETGEDLVQGAGRGAQPPAPPGGMPPPPPYSAGRGPPPPAGPPPARGSLGRRIFSPQTVDAAAGRAGASIRREGGIAARETAQAQHALEPFHAAVNAHPDPPAVIHYIETRPQGRMFPDPKIQAAADAWRVIAQNIRGRLEDMPSTERMSFIEEYYSHMWKNQQQGEAVVRAWKEGSTGPTKERELLTYAEGLERGLEPKFGIMGTMVHYIENMNRFIATNTVFDKAKAAGDVRYIPHGHPAPEGWVKVGGRLGERGGATAYAPEGWARVYNNYISRGIHDVNKDIGELYDIAQRGANFVTMVKLGFSGYHALTMAQEAMVNGLAKGIDELMSGHPLMAAKSAVTFPAKPVTYAMTGKKAQDIYLGQRHRPRMGHNQGPMMETDANDLVDILTEAGARMQGTRHAPDIATSLAGSYVTAWRRGSLKAELAADVAQAKGQYGLGALAVGAKHLGRLMSTVAQPLFEKYIPLVKNGAAMEHLAGWLKRHPNATHEEAVAAARDIVDFVDDRFGEMIQDNVFMNKVIKQAGTLALLSWSWRFGGIVRALGQGAVDTALAPWRAMRKGATGSTGPRGKAVWTPQMSYVMALPLVYGMMAAVYQYLKTGEQPEDIRDLMAPRTGGVDDSGEPERLIMPGYMKDVFGFYNDPLHEATGGINPALTMAGQSLTIAGGKGGSDWRGDPILSQPDEDQPWVANVPKWMQQYMAFVAQNALPISLSQTIFAKESEGSNLNVLERGLGVRSAPAWLTTGEDYNPRKPKTKGQFRRESLRSRRQEEGQEQFPSWMRYGGTQ